ncbi:hypothetical protein [Spongiimicrobium sp. 2-473A-2-J]|uniref:hypothetical protein n=1 Tax=Eudoraea algarum TaxID=3417568 RepID=UPI003D36EC94
MKTLRKRLWLIALFAFCAIQAQQKKTEDKKVIKEVDEVNKTTEEVNQTAKNTDNAIKSTVENSKETIKTIGSLFGSGKNKGKTAGKSKGSITIAVSQVSYDNVHLNRLYSHLSNAKGVKKPTKSFGESQASINLIYKESADALWQGVPKQLRSAFKMLRMDDKSMALELADLTLEE